MRESSGARLPVICVSVVLLPADFGIRLLVLEGDLRRPASQGRAEALAAMRTDAMNSFEHVYNAE